MTATFHPRHRGFRTLAGLVVTALLLLAVACTAAPATSAVAPPDTPAGIQLRWLVATTAHLPVSDAVARAHLDPGYLAMVSPAALNQWLQALNEGLRAAGGVALDSIRVDEPTMVVAVVSGGGAGPRGRIGITVGSRGLIGDVDISPVIAGPVPTTWAGVDDSLRSVAPQVRMLVADVGNGSCHPVHSIDSASAAPFGSVMKLYVLAALGDAVAAGKVHWDQQLIITPQLKSLPSGVLQYEPDGTRISVRDAAAKMIVISDNTATDMLINLVGRSAVETALTRAGMAEPALDRPFLTTRESYVLTLEQWPTLAQRYLAANEAGRRMLLADTVDSLPLPDASAMSALSTRGETGVGWVASADDVCRVYAYLAALTQRPGLSPIGRVLSLGDDILALDPAQWTTTWRKGGVGPGLLAWAYLATTRAGHTYVVVTALSGSSSQPVDGNRAAPVLLSAMKGAFTLAPGG